MIRRDFKLNVGNHRLLDADYDENVIFQENEVTDAIQEASYIIDLLPFSQS